ncbi:MAG: nucleotidyltransferase domain-containing protein [Ignavibacteriales bacterium]|nr:nucleotidyltransferase domain-containing protein [Ignavibacteriales bacterium]
MTSTELERIMQPIVEKLRSDYAPLKIILFGSYAIGAPKTDSDIDLLIVKETSERFIDRWVAVRKILSDPFRKVAIETLVLTPQEVSDRLSRGDQFVAEIMEKGRVLYAA